MLCSPFTRAEVLRCFNHITKTCIPPLTQNIPSCHGRQILLVLLPANDFNSQIQSKHYLLRAGNMIVCKEQSPLLCTDNTTKLNVAQVNSMGFFDMILQEWSVSKVWRC